MLLSSLVFVHHECTDLQRRKKCALWIFFGLMWNDERCQVLSEEMWLSGSFGEGWEIWLMGWTVCSGPNELTDRLFVLFISLLLAVFCTFRPSDPSWRHERCLFFTQTLMVCGLHCVFGFFLFKHRLQHRQKKAMKTVVWSSTQRALTNIPFPAIKPFS